ncbi:MAG: response regulator [Deltaproteobacteria bacterium]|nr:response regulator [Deltaproteobacteria bacterium]
MEKNDSLKEEADIIVVDDTPSDLHTLIDMLREEGYHVRGAVNGELALQAVKQKLPDLILLDIRMPDCNGFEVCRVLKADERSRHVPVIFVTILEDLKDRLLGFEVGAVDYIPKPIHQEEVVARVNAHLTIHFLQKQLKKTNADLEQIVADRTKALTETNEALKSEIEERKKAEEEVTNALGEKNALLREVFHRTKNNMQVICGMLELQSQFIDDDILSNILKKTESRIMSMALVHDMLYKSKSLFLIELGQFIRELSINMQERYSSLNNNISFHFDLSEIPLNIDSAIPCGLVINELLANALMYAFPGGRAGSVSVAVSREKDDMIKITIADNGIGMPQGFDLKHVDSYGLKIASSIVEKQLQGNIEIVRSAGTAYEITFKEKDYKIRV